jgi:hypothetical protein
LDVALVFVVVADEGLGKFVVEVEVVGRIESKSANKGLKCLFLNCCSSWDFRVWIPKRKFFFFIS